jgi:hypothetical protein
MKNKNSKRKQIILFIFFLSFCCLIPVFYFTIARDLDKKECIPRTAKNIGVDAETIYIYQWIYQNEVPGISREESRLILEKIAPITLVDTRSIANGTFTDTIRINICSHPMNNIVLSANYSKDNYLLGINIDFD